MNTSIFIKTWEGDLEWLQYCLRSIRKYAHGIEEVVIAADASCYSKVAQVATTERLVSVPDWGNGYVQQQWVKLSADEYTKSDNILFVDSDCIFYADFSPYTFIRDGKPILLKTRYELLKDNGGVWQPITERIVGFPVSYEYMRRLPAMYTASSLANFKNKYHWLRDYLHGMETREFSEFNALGAFIDTFESEHYYVSDTEVWLPEAVAKQYWSWGGITTEIRAEIVQFLQGTEV